MKYWIGYLTAGIIAAITWALSQLGGKFTKLVDMVYPYVSRTIQDMLAAWSAPLDFCLWQVLAVAAIAVVILIVVLVILFHGNLLRWAGWLLAGASTVYLLHMLVFGLNYYAGPLAEDIRLEQRKYSVEELTSAAAYYRDRANLLSDRLDRDAEGNLLFDDFGTLAQKAANGFDHLVYDYSYPVFAGSTLPVKELGWAGMYSSMGITGITFGLTGEAAVNPQIPATCLPFTMCHEMAHRMSIATERDANFAGFLAAMANDDIQFQYSAYFMAYRYCCNTLYGINTAESVEAAARLSSLESDELRQDLANYSKFFRSRRSEAAAKVADVANDTYLKASGDSAGVASYGNVTDLLVNWHYQQIVLPQIQGEQIPFDPMDENQVDLSGIANAKPPKETEPSDEGGVG